MPHASDNAFMSHQNGFSLRKPRHKLTGSTSAGRISYDSEWRIPGQWYPVRGGVMRAVTSGAAGDPKRHRSDGTSGLLVAGCVAIGLCLAVTPVQAQGTVVNNPNSQFPSPQN